MAVCLEGDSMPSLAPVALIFEYLGLILHTGLAEWRWLELADAARARFEYVVLPHCHSVLSSTLHLVVL
jgi:hypothetical protein